MGSNQNLVSVCAENERHPYGTRDSFRDSQGREDHHQDISLWRKDESNRGEHHAVQIDCFRRKLDANQRTAAGKPTASRRSARSSIQKEKGSPQGDRSHKHRQGTAGGLYRKNSRYAGGENRISVAADGRLQMFAQALSTIQRVAKCFWYSTPPETRSTSWL